MKESKGLKRRLLLSVVALFLTLSSMMVVTYAWYVYQTDVKISDVHLAVGSASFLRISNQYDGEYKASTVMEEFRGRLNPVSTDLITGGFQKVVGFVEGGQDRPFLLANLFEKSDGNDYYRTTLYVKTSGEKQNVYLSDIGFEDESEENPISTAIRVGLVVHSPGENTPVAAEYIFAINEKENPKGRYNTLTGEEGHVLDHRKTDGSTVRMDKLYTREQYCLYNKETGKVTLKETSLPLFSLQGNNEGGYGEIVRVDVYLWLEGCDKDCANNLCDTSLSKISISFASKPISEIGGD